VASADLAHHELGWQPRFGKLDDMVASAWEWMSAHPKGYE
jgi:UDP-glucose 4-epimerase